MPDFEHAEVQNTIEDLSSFTAFLSKYTIGQVIMVPLSLGETGRRVMRAFNRAAKDRGWRLIRLKSAETQVRFRIAPLERRPVNLSEEAKSARVAKSLETRARNKAAAAH